MARSAEGRHDAPAFERLGRRPTSALSAPSLDRPRLCYTPRRGAPPVGPRRRRAGQDAPIARQGSLPARRRRPVVRGRRSPSRGENRLPDPHVFQRRVVYRRRRAVSAQPVARDRRELGRGLLGRPDLVRPDVAELPARAGPDRPGPGRGPAADQPARRRLVGAARGHRRRRPRPRPPGVHPLLRDRPTSSPSSRASRSSSPTTAGRPARWAPRSAAWSWPTTSSPTPKFGASLYRTSTPITVIKGGVDGAHFTPPAAARAATGSSSSAGSCPTRGSTGSSRALPPELPADRLRPALSARILRGPQGARRRQGRDLRHRRRRRRDPRPLPPGLGQRPALGLPRLLRPDPPLPRADGLHPPGGDGLRDPGDLLERRGDARVRPRRRDRLRLRRPRRCSPTGSGGWPTTPPWSSGWAARPAGRSSRSTTSGSPGPG